MAVEQQLAFQLHMRKYTPPTEIEAPYLTDYYMTINLKLTVSINNILKASENA